MKINKNIIIRFAAAAIGLFMLAGCAEPSETPSEGETVLSNTYAFIAKDIQNPYMQKVYEGFQTACSEVGSSAIYKAPEANTPEKQVEIINELVLQGIEGIAVAANDEDKLEDALKAAMESGVKVISLDSAVNKESRQTHIQQADPELIGRSLVRAAYDIVGGNGGIGVLSTTNQATNQNLWISYMEQEIAENPEKYASTPIVQIAYGDDDTTKSISETQSLLENPDIKVIIAPTSVGIKAAAQTLQELGSDVKVTGLGMPSQMAEYIESGICPKMYLWNPVDIGYLAGYTLDALSDGTITGAQGEVFTAGTLGERTITLDDEQGTEIMLGDLLEFDSGNIGEWKDAF
ncbi:MAG: substrate-binding domain-containing protein [Oscillospiraceae bacterium]|nr:substrate-binding domain-containing protein [Oscillospiraceae bacterium]